MTRLSKGWKFLGFAKELGKLSLSQNTLQMGPGRRISGPLSRVWGEGRRGTEIKWEERSSANSKGVLIQQYVLGEAPVLGQKSISTFHPSTEQCMDWSSHSIQGRDPIGTPSCSVTCEEAVFPVHGSLTVSCSSAGRFSSAWKENRETGKRGSCINLSRQSPAFLICYVNLSL